MRLLRKPISLARVTKNTGTNDVFPCRCPTAITRHDVIQIQVVAIENISTILTGIFIALENVVTRKLDFLFRQPIKKQQNDHSRNTNLPGNGRDHFVVRRRGREITPAVEIMSQEIIRFIG